MKNITKFCKVIALVVALAGAGGAQSTWPLVELPPAVVAFPQAPVHKQSSNSTIVGSIDVDNYRLDGEGLKFMASATKLPSAITTLQGANGVYRQANREVLKENQVDTATDVQKITLLGQPGSELTFQGHKNTFVKVDFVLIDSTLYTFQAQWTGPVPPPSVSQFFQSIMLKQTN